MRPADEDLRRAADVLNAGEKVAILVGQGARHAADELIEVADLLGAGVAKALNGRAVLPDDLPFVTGSIGLLGTKPSADMMEGCDTLLMVGTWFPYSEWLPEPGQARGVQIDIDARPLGIRYPMEVPSRGDAAATLRALAPLLERKQERAGARRSRRRRALVAAARRARPRRGRADQPAARVPRALRAAARRAIVLADSGSATNWFARHLRLRSRMDGRPVGTLATMCPAVPYALAAKLASPAGRSSRCLGDGAMQMLGINALIDLARLPASAGATRGSSSSCSTTRPQSGHLGAARPRGRRKLRPRRAAAFDFAALRAPARPGGHPRGGRPRDRPGVGSRPGRRAPCVLEVVTDPEVPPLPPHIRPEHAKGFARAVLPGDPESARIVRQSLREKIKDLVT